MSTATVVALVPLLLNILALAELWQRKEYRWDRMQAYLLSPESREVVIPYLIGAVLTLIGALAVNYSTRPLPTLFGWLGLLTFVFYYGAQAYRRGIFRPALTLKVSLVITALTVTATVYYGFVFKPTWPDALDWASLLVFMPILSIVSVAATNVLTAVRKRQIISQATNLRQRLTNLTVVGITGSYGKTSTKHFLTQLMPEAAATKEHRNSEVAVAQDMLKQLSKQRKTYIVEMGAYKKGEIAALAKLTKPAIGIVTAIGNQHMALFSSQENILAAKWELVSGLPSEGIAILNADDSLVRQKSKNYSGKILWYSRMQPTDVYASNIRIEPESLICQLHVRDDAQIVTIPLASDGLLGNVLAAVAAAHLLGVETSVVFKRVQALHPYPRTMQIIHGKNNALIIDDSYSANEQGVMNALYHLQRFSTADKRIVLLPLIELGSAGHLIHERIGNALAKTKASIYISGTAFRQSLLKGVRHANPSVTLKFIKNPLALARAVAENAGSDTVILLEGRIPDVVRQALLQQKSTF